MRPTLGKTERRRCGRMYAPMSNWRFILFFLVGIAACAAGLWGLSARERVVASDATRRVLCPVDPDTVDAVAVSARGGMRISLERRSGAWRIVEPFPAAADPAPVAQLLDMLTLTPIDDMRTEDELTQLNETFSDFGLNPPRATVSLAAAGVTNVIHLGAATASGKEVYARVEDVRNVFSLPPRDEIAGLEFRMPDAAFVKLVREGSTWRMTAPLAAAADAAAVSALADRLAAARVADFTLPSAAQPPPHGTTPDGTLPAAALVPYGLSVDAALSVTVRAMDGSVETVLFGGAAGTNRVWALVQNGAAVVSVDASLAELCRAHEAAFRDTRVFSFKADEALKSRMKSSMLQQERIEDLESLLGIPRGSVRRMECFDVSHTFGERTVASYKKLFGHEPEVKAIHAGLECGLFLEKFPDLDMISFGPTLRGVHAPGEKLELASLDKFVAHLNDLVLNFE